MNWEKQFYKDTGENPYDSSGKTFVKYKMWLESKLDKVMKLILNECTGCVLKEGCDDGKVSVCNTIKFKQAIKGDV